jgi:hypothetical protein
MQRGAMLRRYDDLVEFAGCARLIIPEDHRAAFCLTDKGVTVERGFSTTRLN